MTKAGGNDGESVCDKDGREHVKVAVLEVV